MKQAVIRIQLLLVVLMAAGCYPNRGSIFSNTPASTKEILINNERYDKPFVVLGPVEYTLKKNTTLFVDQIDLREQAIDSLKQTALARYGQRVDAIVDVQVVENSLEGVEDKLNVTHVKGTAIAFLPAYKAYKKPKSRPKPIKNIVRKTRPPLVRKESPSDVTITPSEILK